MSDSDRKVDRNIYSDAATRDGIRLIDPKSGIPSRVTASGYLFRVNLSVTIRRFML